MTYDPKQVIVLNYLLQFLCELNYVTKIALCLNGDRQGNGYHVACCHQMALSLIQ